MNTKNPVYKRMILKLSGEALAGDKKQGLCIDTVTEICKVVKKCHDAGVEIGIVVGGGNYWRGRSAGISDKITADHIGMLATMMNALAVANVLEALGCEVRVQSAISMMEFAEPCIRQKALNHFKKDRIIVFGCGTGNPSFSTDSAAALRASELNADIMLKATMVDGVYDKDPLIFDDAVKYETMKVKDILVGGLRVLDGTAAAMCVESKIPIIVFNLHDPENIFRAVTGENIGTKVE
ncbi:MAG: UMP kinase [Oscillospiraceae bacterium]|nr:UMP kinase [Oscillospiraceae bacterium]